MFLFFKNAMTLHKINQNKYVVCIVNYSDEKHDCLVEIDDGWQLTPINDCNNVIGKCDAGFYYLDKK